MLETDAARASVQAAHLMSDMALDVSERSRRRWGPRAAVEMIGESPEILDLQSRIKKIAKFQEPVLIAGESGVGKELVARSVYLLSDRGSRPYVSVNCPQYCEGNLTVSELFGHKKGSFTGAVANHRGAFEEADGGVIFLDEVADLHLSAQAMLLRALATGEFTPVGSSRCRFADIRVIAATNRALSEATVIGDFRRDLYFRLRYFLIRVPPLRERGDDWRMIADYTLMKLRRRYGISKHLSPASLRLLEGYSWPGNIRQLISTVTMGYAMSDSAAIQPGEFSAQLEIAAEAQEPSGTLYRRVVIDGEDFWETVHKGFMQRDLNRAQVKTLIKQGLLATNGSYRELLKRLQVPASQYQKFMDFLRHHDLKP